MNPRKPPAKTTAAARPVFEPDPDAVYTLDVIVELTGLSAQTIIHYQEQGLINSVAFQPPDEWKFNEEALRTLRRIEHLRAQYEMNQRGLKLTLGLLDEVERLRADLRSRR